MGVAMANLCPSALPASLSFYSGLPRLGEVRFGDELRADVP
jgi:hypothetical protein